MKTARELQNGTLDLAAQKAAPLSENQSGCSFVERHHVTPSQMTRWSGDERSKDFLGDRRLDNRL